MTDLMLPMAGHISIRDFLGHANITTASRYLRSTPVRLAQAHLWFDLAASRTTGEDRENLVKLRDLAANLLTPDGLNEAQRLAREWDAAHPR